MGLPEHWISPIMLSEKTLHKMRSLIFVVPLSSKLRHLIRHLMSGREKRLTWYYRCYDLKSLMPPLMRLPGGYTTRIHPISGERVLGCFHVRPHISHAPSAAGLTLSSFASISTTSVSTSSMFALKNTNKSASTECITLLKNEVFRDFFSSYFRVRSSPSTTGTVNVTVQWLVESAYRLRWYT